MKKILCFCAVSLLVGICCLWSWAGAGDLNPPGAPTVGTMKPLDQVEPRIPIPASDSWTGSFVIDESGSYYLEGNRLCNSHGIQVNADHVTIDLMGYSLIGPDSGTGHGILITGLKNVEIKNGNVRDFGQSGVFDGAGSDGKNRRIINVRVLSNKGGGIVLDNGLNNGGHLIQNCTAADNGEGYPYSAYGIYAGRGSTVIGNTASNNGTSAMGSVYGIYAENSTVVNNTASNNGTSAMDSVYGIYASNSAVIGNTASNNGHNAQGLVCGILISGGSATGNSAYGNGNEAAGHEVCGIKAGSGSTITSNMAADNGDNATQATACIYGIYAVSACTVIGNTAYSNGSGAAGSSWGIYLGTDCLVDQNTANDNGVNMNIPGSGLVTATNYAP